MEKIISTQDMNITKGFNKKKYVIYKPKRASVFVTKLRGTRILLLLTTVNNILPGCATEVAPVSQIPPKVSNHCKLFHK